MADTKEGCFCKIHPKFNPKQKDISGENAKCLTCCHLHNGARCIGYFTGEHDASAYDIDRAKIKIGPLNLTQMGQVRFALGWDYHFSDGPSFHVDKKTMTVYLDEEPYGSRIDEFQKEHGCLIYTRTYSRPSLFIKKVSRNKTTGQVDLQLLFGEKKIHLTLKNGMTEGEILDISRKLSSEVIDTPSENVVEVLLKT